jgi:hypothetical protein
LRSVKNDIPTQDVVDAMRTDRSCAYKVVEYDIYMDIDGFDEPVACIML